MYSSERTTTILPQLTTSNVPISEYGYQIHVKVYYAKITLLNGFEKACT